MKHTINKIVLQGRAGPPTVRLSPAGRIFTSTELQINDCADTTVPVYGAGAAAGCIADGKAGDYLHVEGELAFDAEKKRFYVFAHTSRRMKEQDGALVPLASSMNALDRFEKLFLEESPPSK
jgi:hypothetical protein